MDQLKCGQVLRSNFFQTVHNSLSMRCLAQGSSPCPNIQVWSIFPTIWSLRAHRWIQTQVFSCDRFNKIFSFWVTQSKFELSCSRVSYSHLQVCSTLVTHHIKKQSQLVGQHQSFLGFPTFHDSLGKLCIRKQCHVLLRGRLFRHSGKWIISCKMYLEPIGGSAPKLSGVSKLSSLVAKFSSPQSIACPAQGSPVPSFR